MQYLNRRQFNGLAFAGTFAPTVSYSWKLGPGDGTINVDSVVRWELKPTEKGTELLLDHGDFEILENPGIFGTMEKGWLENMHKILDRLNEIIHGTTNA